MKLAKIILGGVGIALLLFWVSPASAASVRSRPANGVIEQQDVQAGVLTFMPDRTNKPTQYLLKSDTQFVRNGRFVPPSELKANTKAVIYYRSPFFGKPFVTRITWVSDP